MEKTNNRIPKLTFGFRKTARTNGTVSEGNTPRGATNIASPRSTTPTAPRSAPGSNNTSPNLSRSKSLRVPRSAGSHLKAHSNSSLLEHDHNSLSSRSSSSIPEGGDSVDLSLGREGGEPSFLRRPRSKTIGSRIRPPASQRHSRSVSPGTVAENEQVNGDDNSMDSFEVWLGAWSTSI